MSDTNFRYKVRARRGQDWRKFDTVRLEISIGEEQHEGMKLCAAVDWAVNNFKKVVVLVADTQQRFNFMFEGLPEEEAFNRALKAGDDWLQKYSEILSSPAIEMVRWEDVKQAPEWKDLYRNIKSLYETSPAFAEKVDIGVNAHWKRHSYPPERYDEYRFFSLQYAIEEISVFALVYKKYAGISAYPGTLDFSRAMYESQEVGNVPEGFAGAHFTSLCFEKRQAA